MKIQSFVIYTLLLFLAHQTLSAAAKTHKTLTITEIVSQGLTPKQKCIKKIAYFYRHRYLKWYTRTHLSILRKKASFLKPPHGRKLETQKSQNNTRQNNWRFVASNRRQSWVYRPRRPYQRPQPRRRRYLKKKKPHMQNLFGLRIHKSTLNRRSRAYHLLKNHWRSVFSNTFKSRNHEIFAEDQIWYMLNYYDRLPLKYKMSIKNCNLNMTPAIQRCESLYGKKSCKMISPTMVQKQCSADKEQIGCCECAKSCPKGTFETKGFYCTKVKYYAILNFNSLDECNKYNNSGTASKKEAKNESSSCTKVKENVFQPNCKPGFSKEIINGQNSCLVKCPEGFSQHRRNKLRCLRPGRESLGTPFIWIKSDK